MIKQNIGILNALVRITCGLTFITISGVRLARKPKKEGSILLLIMSAMKVAEGIVRYCPVTDVATRMIDNASENNSNSQTMTNNIADLASTNSGSQTSSINDTSPSVDNT